MSATHTCKGVVLHCIDFRFRRQLGEFLHKRFPDDDYDLIANAGGAKSLLMEGEDSTFLIKQFDTSFQLHKSSVIVLIQHEDCGAYGGSETLGDFEEELHFQKKELRKAKNLLQDRFSEITIEMYLIRLSGEVLSL